MRNTELARPDPLRIGAVSTGNGQGRIGITLCPGKTDPHGMFGSWARDLDADLDVIRDWGATAVVSLVTEEEIEYLQVGGLSEAVRDRHMEWWHLPIPDGMPPQSGFEEKWTEAGEAIRDRLRLGFDVLLHCKGGLGRAGTIAACLLVELGAQPGRRDPPCARGPPGRHRELPPGGLCRALHAAGGGSPRAGSRTTSGTGRSGRFSVWRWAMRSVPRLSSVPATLKPRLNDMVGGGPFGLPPGGWTDDTSMALALADSLAVCGTLDCRDLMDRFVRWWREGDIFAYRSLLRYRRDGKRRAGAISADRRPDGRVDRPLESAGNGSLMRLAPVALRFWTDRARLGRVAEQQSRTTHGAEEAVDACRGFADMLADAISGKARPDVLSPRAFEGAPRISEILGGSWRQRTRDDIRSSGYVVHTLEAAIWSVARTANFRDAVLLAANLADDADTVAAVTGQLAGAIYGLSGIPQHWLDQIAWKDRTSRYGAEAAGIRP